MRKIREVYAELERLNRQALDPAAHQNPARMNQLNQEMKRLRASVGEQTLGGPGGVRVGGNCRLLRRFRR